MSAMKKLGAGQKQLMDTPKYIICEIIVTIYFPFKHVNVEGKHIFFNNMQII